MASVNVETFCAGTFDFYVGPEKVRFILYRNLVSRYSAPLDSMMSNGMKESQEGAAFLDNVDVGTFGRFAEYVHSGNYSPAAPVQVSPTAEEYKVDGPIKQTSEADDSFAEADTASPLEESDRSGWNSRSLSRKSKMKRRKRRSITPVSPEPAEGNSLDPPTLSPFPVEPPPGPNESSLLSYTPTFTSHVAVHHFAQYYLMPHLKQLALQKFSDVLNCFHCFPERVGDICEVVRLVYNHEDGSSGPSALHDVISEYCTNNFRVLMGSSKFKSLLTEGGAFPADLCSRVARLL